jgi:hypothetical protein
MEQKVIRANKKELPWSNSDSVNCVKLILTSCEVDDECKTSDPVSVGYIYSIYTLPYVLGVINQTPEILSLDTGSTLNLARASSFDKEPTTPVTGLELTSASGHNIGIRGKIMLKVRLGKLEIPCEFMLIDGLEMKLLLGNDIFTNYKINIDYKNMVCEFFLNGNSSGPIPLNMQDVKQNERYPVNIEK